MTRNRHIFILIFLFILHTNHVWSADMIKKGDVLSLEQCVNMALTNHPVINAAAGLIRQSDAKIGQARAEYYPQIRLQSGYSRIGPAAMSLNNPSHNQYTNTLILNQTLFDFGKTSTWIDIRKLGKQTAEADFQNTRSAVTFSVKEAYYTLLKAKMSEIVAAETVAQFQRHLDVAKTFFETGRSSKIDVTSAEVNLSNARIQWISAQNAMHIARANLNNAMGVSSAPAYSVREDFHPAPLDISFEDALSRAYENRPDILSANLKIDAMKKTIDLNKKGYLPVLTGSADYGYAGSDTDMYQSWSAGVFLSFPFFTGLSTKYAIEEAKANLHIAASNEEALRQAVYLEVQSAWLNSREAFERIEAGRIIVRQAEEALELASGRYATGVGNFIEITDAMIKLNNAKMGYINTLSDFEIAEALLEKAIGAKP